MLKKYKNYLMELIKEAGLNPEHFSITEDEIQFTIQFLNTPLMFYFLKSEKSFHDFKIRYSCFDRKYPISEIMISDFNGCSDSFNHWLLYHVTEYLIEKNTPDLWKQLEDQKTLLDYTHQDDDKATHFTDEQKRLIRLGLDEVLLLIKKEFQPTADEIGVIKKQLDYISDALDRLNKFDWKGVLIQTILGISIALTLDTTQGKALFLMFKQVLSKALSLLLK